MRLDGETVFCRGMRLSAESQTLFDRALQWIPGGVNSPVRAFRAVGGNPFFAARANGASVWDADDNEYVDYVGTSSHIVNVLVVVRIPNRGAVGSRGEKRVPSHCTKCPHGRIHPAGNPLQRPVKQGL